MSDKKEKVPRTLYLDEDVSRCVDHMAASLERKVSDTVNEALRFYFKSVLTAEQKRVFRFEDASETKKRRKQP